MTIKTKTGTEGVPTATPPMGRDMGASRSAMTAAVIQWMATAPESDLVSFFEKSLIPPPPVGNNAGRNMASIAMKGRATDGGKGLTTEENEEAPHAFDVVVKDDLKNVFEGDLSEEAKEQVTTLFEAALSVRVNEAVIQLQEEHDRVLTEEVEKLRETLSEDVDNYLSFAAEKWLEENKLEVEAGIRTEMTERFMSGLKVLFKESYVEIPEDKIDLVANLQEQLANLQTKLDENVDTQIKMAKELAAQQQRSVFGEVATGLSQSQVEKFRTLASNIREDDLDAYRNKLNMIREGYFKAPTIVEQAEVVGITSLNEEEVASNTGPAYANSLVEMATKVLAKSARV